jgi:hypothetical protein
MIPIHPGDFLSGRFNRVPAKELQIPNCKVKNLKEQNNRR